MHLVFYSTNDVFAAEETLLEHNIFTDIVPTPVQDKAFCGICIYVVENDVINSINILDGFDFKKVE